MSVYEANLDYEKYLVSEWDDYPSHPERYRASLAAVNGKKVTHVLDVGCGAGQELLPFVRELGARGAGVDISPKAIEVARRQFAALDCRDQVEFSCCPAESLPYPDGRFDVVMCRVALPFTENGVALSEMARVLRPDGLIILKIHHFLYYWRRFWIALGRGQVRQAAAIGRVLFNGTVYHLTGRQPHHGPRMREVFQTRWMLHRVFARLGLQIRGELQNSDSNHRSPVYLIERATPASLPKLEVVGTPATAA